jgi:hypothetical protein
MRTEGVRQRAFVGARICICAACCGRFRGYLHEDEYGESIERHDGAGKSLLSELNRWASERVLVYTSDLIIVAYRIPGLSNHLDRGRISLLY